MAKVHCRLCKEEIDKDKEIEGVDWIQPSNRQYYHKKCYDSWKQSEPAKDEAYISFIYDFISRDLKAPYDFFKCEAQRKKFLKEGMTNKGVFFALKYFYEIKKGDWSKGYDGIGIVPYIYKEAQEYWAKRERSGERILEQIEQQMKIAGERKAKVVIKETTTRKLDIDFSIVDEMENDE